MPEVNSYTNLRDAAQLAWQLEHLLPYLTRLARAGGDAEGATLLFFAEMQVVEHGSGSADELNDAAAAATTRGVPVPARDL